jgi:hypothetical protein
VNILYETTLHIVGWVEPTPCFVGFLRLRRTNLHFAGFISKCKTQQQPNLDPSQTSFFFDQTGHLPAGGWAENKKHLIGCGYQAWICE